MSIWSASTIQRFTEYGEEEFAREIPCILMRKSISITAGTAQYTLPSYTKEVRRITWKGVPLTVLSHRALRRIEITRTAQGRPEEYVHNNIGKQVIQFFPVPNETIGHPIDSVNGAGINTGVIVEFWRMPDYNLITIPAYLRRRILKAYVNYRAYLQEGLGLNIKASDYFKLRWELYLQIHGGVLKDIINKPRKLIASGDPQLDRETKFAQLPIEKIGIGVDDFEAW
jgi:hypothetical protein